jgi:hypothetical protein
MPKLVGYLFGFGRRETVQNVARCEIDFNHFNVRFVFGIRPRSARAAPICRALASRWIADPDDVVCVHISILIFC